MGSHVEPNMAACILSCPIELRCLIVFAYEFPRVPLHVDFPCPSNNSGWIRRKVKKV